MDNYFGMKLWLDLFGVVILLIYTLSYYSELIYLKLFFYLNTPTIFEVDKSIIDKI